MASVISGSYLLQFMCEFPQAYVINKLTADDVEFVKQRGLQIWGVGGMDKILIC